MNYLAYIAIGFILMQLINVIINGLWMQRLKNRPTARHKQLSILIPARDEAAHIGRLLTDLAQLKSEHLEILVYDDQSTDNTPTLVKTLSKQDQRIQLLEGTHLPQGWLGKNHACYQLAQKAQGDYFLFLDADVRLDSSIIHDALAKLERHHVHLLSIFPSQIRHTFGEQASVPVMNYILLTLLPLVFVRVSPFASHAAANGQFMLFEAKTYRERQPHQQFKANPVEDIAIAKDYKRHKLNTACITGDKRLQCRMYHSYQEALQGFSKNVFMFFGNKKVLSLLFWACAALGFVPVLIAQAQLLPWYIMAVILIQLIYASISKMSPLKTVLLFPIHLFFLLQLIVTSLRNSQKKHSLWKGRNIYS